MNIVTDGQSFARREDDRLISGHGRYVDDVAHPDALRVAFVRSPYAAATILSVNVQEACASQMLSRC
jgi:aerobic carbon-monoxide dehydrogenase large subunit